MKDEGGFLLIELLISAVILTASIAATMMIFRGGFQQLERADHSNGISAILPQIMNRLQRTDLNGKEGEEVLGSGIAFHWDARLESESRSGLFVHELARPIHEIFLYKVHVLLTNGDLSREYDVHIFKSNRVQRLPQEPF